MPLDVAPASAHTAMLGADGRVLYSGISHRLAQVRLTDEIAGIAGYADRCGRSFESVLSAVEHLRPLGGHSALSLPLDKPGAYLGVPRTSIRHRELYELVSRGYKLASTAVRPFADGIARAVVIQSLQSDPEKRAQAGAIVANRERVSFPTGTGSRNRSGLTGWGWCRKILLKPARPNQQAVGFILSPAAELS